MHYRVKISLVPKFITPNNNTIEFASLSPPPWNQNSILHEIGYFATPPSVSFLYLETGIGNPPVA